MSTYLYAQYDGHLRCSSNNVSTDGIKVEFTDKVVILRLGDPTDVWKPSVFSSYCVVCVCVCMCVCLDLQPASLDQTVNSRQINKLTQSMVQIP